MLCTANLETTYIPCCVCSFFPQWITVDAVPTPLVIQHRVPIICLCQQLVAFNPQKACGCSFQLNRNASNVKRVIVVQTIHVIACQK